MSAGWAAAANLIDSGLNFAGGLIQSGQNSRNIAKQIAYQKEFAQNGVRWRVADAKAAGIHPLAALGAQTTSFAPIAIGDNGIANAFSAMGQGIDRAIMAKQTATERAAEEDYVKASRQLDLLMKNKQIQALDAEIAATKANSEIALRRAQLPPAMPDVSIRTPRGYAPKSSLPGQEVIPTLLKRRPPVSASPSGATLGNDGKPTPQYQLFEDTSGYREVLPSDDYSSIMEDKLVLEWLPWLNSFWEAMFGMPGYTWTWRHGHVKKSADDISSRIARAARRAAYMKNRDYEWSS